MPGFVLLALKIIVPGIYILLDILYLNGNEAKKYFERINKTK
ncbi:MAG: hypothetical protein ACI8SJ_001095 [Shewanella sp.]|jgi:hypothetical protein